jgi:serine/threonine protein kinase
LQRFCVRHLDAFVFKYGGPTIFQVYEFIEGGHDLGTILNCARKNTKSLTWEQRLIMAKVIMAAIHQLHEKKVVHGDLKPANIQMIEDASIKVRYQPKLIDMDYSILADRLAPWHGDPERGYIGTASYLSPEHFEGLIPEPASDVFTCGIILHELLSKGHPFPAFDDESYKAAVRQNAPPLPRLLGSLSDESSTKLLASILQRCLTTDASKRPTALEVARALNGDFGAKMRATAPIHKDETRKPPAPPKADPVDAGMPSLLSLGLKEPQLRAERSTLVLAGPAGGVIRLNVKTEIGRHLLRQASPEADYADVHQFTVEPRDGSWWIEPIEKTHSATTLNGVVLNSATKLNEGDTIGLCGRISGKKAMPVTVKLS